MGRPYAGAGVLASAISMDKDYTKRLLNAAGLPITNYVAFRPDNLSEAEREDIYETIEQFVHPVFVKPARSGSSFGVSRVDTRDALAVAVDLAKQYDRKVLVEEGVIDCREVECGVLGSLKDQFPSVSVCGQVVVEPAHSFYDFAAKYSEEEHTRFEVPAQLENALSEKIRCLAGEAFRVLGCEGPARVDFLIDAADNVYVNEVTTIPGATPLSAFPLLWAASGMDFPSLIDAVLEEALSRPTGLR